MEGNTPTLIPDWSAILSDVKAIVEIVAIIVGGIWVYYKFIRQREDHALIDFSVDIVFHARKDDYWIVELVACLENKGKVQHRVHDFTFELSSLDRGDKVELKAEFGDQVYFPNLISKGSFLPASAKYFFNEPGLKNRYSHIARVPVKSELVIMHSNFKYIDGKHFHTAEVTKAVPPIDLSQK